MSLHSLVTDTARGLFDTDDAGHVINLDTGHPEYARGVSELTARLIGADPDDLPNVLGDVSRYAYTAPTPELAPDLLVHDGIRLSVYFGERDGVPVVQLDTDDEAGRFRINVNDAPVWDGDPDHPADCLACEAGEVAEHAYERPTLGPDPRDVALDAIRDAVERHEHGTYGIPAIVAALATVNR